MICEIQQSARTRRRTLWRKTGLVLVAAGLLAWLGCGDVFRPVAIPLPSPTPDPKNYHYAIVVSQNAVGNPGTGMQIDVSGDTNVGVVAAGMTPVHAMLLPPNANRVYVANGAGNTVSTFTPANPIGF